MDYVAPVTLQHFHLSGAFGRYVVGPVGSGKTTGCVMELLRIASSQAKASDGVRYTRMALVRNTMQQLRTTVLQDILQLLKGAAEYHVSSSTIRVRFGDVVSDWLLMPLDTPDDQRRLLSTQLTMVWVNEFREVPQELIASMSGRVGRYPLRTMGVEPTRFGIIGDSNPYNDGSKWHEFLEVEPNPEHVLFRQPSGMSTLAENKNNLPAEYYERLVASHGPDWVSVHVHGLNGDDLAGLAVFKASFDRNVHIDNEGLEVNLYRPLMIGLDFGRTPTAIITQTTAQGRLNALEEVRSTDMGLQMFLRQKLRPLLTNERFGGRRAFIVADPAGGQRSQISERTAFDVLRDEGFMAIPAPSNDIGVRLRAVEKLLLERDPGGLVIDGRHCKDLVRALTSEYKYKKTKGGDVQDLPDKTHPWSDLADALQYACLGAGSDLSGKVVSRQRFAGQPRRQAPPVGAWT